MYVPLVSIGGFRGANFSRSRLAPELAGFLAEGSYNTLFVGNGYHKVFQGFYSQGAGTGSRVMRPIGKTWGGIKDNGLALASGNVIEDIGRSLWGIGSGVVHKEGTNIGFTLSTQLKLSLLSSGVYQTPVQAGLTQPSAAGVGISTESGNVDGAISVKIEKWRPATGGRSRASTTSAVIQPQKNKVRITFPAIGDGTHWRVYVTLMRFGGEGVHYLVAYNGTIDIPEATVAAGTVDGIARSLLFDWKDSELLGDEASYDDYAPQAGTHLIRLENVMNVLGSLSDAVSSPTSTNPGTAIQVSKTNNYESYVPTHLLFLGEQVVDVLSRPIDSYGLIACENSINALQYVGPRGDDLPACTITTLIPDIGIKYPHNWTHFRGQVCLYTAEGNLLMMRSDGSIDSEFSGEMRKYMQNWLPEETIVGYCPKNDGLIVANGTTVLFYSLETAEWTVLWLPDYGVASPVVSCQAAKRRLYVSCQNGVAYEFDRGASAPVPVSFVSHFTNQPNPIASKNIYQMTCAVETNRAGAPVVVAIAKNLRQIAFRDVAADGITNIVASAAAKFTPAMDYLQFALFGPDIGGAGVDYLTGYARYLNSAEIELTDANGSPLPPQNTGSELLMFLGDYVQTETVSADEAAHLPDFFPCVTDARSFAVAVWTQASDEVGSAMDINLLGTMNPTTRLS